MRRSDGILLAWAAAAVLATAAIYAERLGGPLFFDDSVSVTKNHRIERLWPPAWAWHEEEHPLAARPVPAFTLALDFALHGRSPTGYRVFNLLLHLTNALLLMLVVRRLLGRSPALGASDSEVAGLAGAIGLLWAIHPLQTEAVIYVTQRTELVVALCTLATLHAAIRGFDARTSRGAARWYGVAIGACWVGALSKEVIAAAPLLVLLADRAFVSGAFAEAVRRRRGLYAGLGSSWVILAALLVAGPRAASVSVSQSVSPLDYLRTQAGVIAEYLRLCFWPDALRLSYPLRTVRTWADLPPEGALVVLLAALAFWACWRRPRAGFAGAWFFLILAPSSSVVPIVTEIAAQRRMYLSLAAVIAAVIVPAFAGAQALLRRGGGATVLRERGLPLAGIALVAAAALALAWRADERLADFRSRVAIWSAEARTDPGNPTAYLNLAMALLDEGRHELALGKLGEAGRALGRLDRPTQALILRATSLGVLAAAYQATGRPDLVLPLFRQLAADHPDLLEVQLPYGELCLVAGAVDEAVAPLRRAAELAPASARPWARLAEAYARAGRSARAIEALGEAIGRAEGTERARLVARREYLLERAAAR